MNLTVIIIVVVAALVIGFLVMGRAAMPRHARKLVAHPRMVEAMMTEVNKETYQPKQAFYDAAKRGQRHLLAAFEADNLIGGPDRARYNSFWRALWVQDDEFWAALDRGDTGGWTRLEVEHGVRVLHGPISPPADGGRRG